MIRKSTVNINYSNINKLNSLNLVINESKRVINLFIEELWKKKDFSSKFVNFKVNTWLSAVMQQCLGKQALEIVKSQRKRKNKVMPVFRSNSIELDSRIVDIQFDNNSFDIWIRLTCLGNKIMLNLPAKKHKHFNGLLKNSSVKKSIKLRKVNDNFYVDIYFDKKNKPLKTKGKSLGVDIGYKKLLAISTGKNIGIDFETIYKKIARKKQGSNAFKRALIERNNSINRVINKDLNLNDIKEIVAEDLKCLKYKTKGRFRKSFNNKLQRWSYPKVLNKLSMICEEKGILFTKVNPSYTSQTCSNCGFKHKKNRNGEIFKCLNCEAIIDADTNAAINISRLGVYSPQALNLNNSNKILLNK